MAGENYLGVYPTLSNLNLSPTIHIAENPLRSYIYLECPVPAVIKPPNFDLRFQTSPKRTKKSRPKAGAIQIPVSVFYGRG